MAPQGGFYRDFLLSCHTKVTAMQVQRCLSHRWQELPWANKSEPSVPLSGYATARHEDDTLCKLQRAASTCGLWASLA